MLHLLSLAVLLQAAAPAQAPVRSPVADEPLTLPAIVYPADAKAQRIQGTVHLLVEVDPTGHVTHVRALDGPAALQQAALDAYSAATYRPLLKDGLPAPAEITTAVNFTLTEAPPEGDTEVDARFQPLHALCQQQSAAHSPAALTTCRQAVDLSRRFTPHAELAARATAYNDLVLLLIAQGKKSPDLPEAGQIADLAVNLVAGISGPETPAVAVAYITRAEVRSLADDLKGAASDCHTAEETLTTLLQNQARPGASDLERTETERAGNYRVQLRDTLLLHAIVLDRQHKAKEAKALRDRAATM